MAYAFRRELGSRKTTTVSLMAAINAAMAVQDYDTVDSLLPQVTEAFATWQGKVVKCSSLGRKELQNG